MASRLLNGTAPQSTVLEPFDIVGDYCLVQFIGRGGMGEVWLGVKRGTMRPVAIKFLHPGLAKNERCVESFQREAEIGMQLGGNGPIVAVHDRLAEELVGDPECPDRLLYLVLDFVDGVNLRRFSDRFFKTMKERLPIQVVVHIVRLMLRAVDAAHTHGIGKSALPVVHGDINPGNVLISSRGEVKVTDFGISRFAPQPTFISRPVGTLPYMAPEQYLGRICPQNDLYSVGAVLHELLTGEPPLPTEGSPRTTERKLFQDPVPALSRDDVPDALDRLRRALLEKNADLRIQNADEALELLATVEQADCQDQLKTLYVRMFGPPRSRLTKYLEGSGNGAGSFVIELLRQQHRPGTAEIPSSVELRPAVAPAPEADDDDGMPWLTEDEHEDEHEPPKTDVYERPAHRITRTIRLEGTVGTAPSLEQASTPTVPETPRAANDAPEADDDDDDPLDALVTTPRLEPARTAASDDGVPRPRRRTHRWERSRPLDGVPIDRASGEAPRGERAGSDPVDQPRSTRPEHASETRPGASDSSPSLSRDAGVHGHLLVLAIGAGLFGLGLVMLAWTLISREPSRGSSASSTSSTSSNPAAEAGTGGTEP